MSERVHCIVVSHRHVAEHGTPEADVNPIGLRRNRELHLLNGRTIRSRTIRPRDRRYSARELDVLRRELPEVASQPNGQAGACDREQHTRVPEAGNFRDRLSQARCVAQRSDAERGRRATVQYDPVVDIVGFEETLPALLAHARSMTTNSRSA